MKKIIVSLLCVSTVIACKENGNKNVKKTDSTAVITADNGKLDTNIGYNLDVHGKKTIKTDYVYKATDGTLVKVVFDYTPKKGNVSITNNNKTFILEKVSSDGNETIYEKSDMKASVKGDSLIITQGNNIIELAKTKI